MEGQEVDTFESYELDDVLHECFENAVAVATNTPSAEAFVRAYLDEDDAAFQATLCALIASGVAVDAARRALALRHDSTQLSLF